MGRQQNRASNSSRSRQNQSGYEPRSQQSVAPLASNNSSMSDNRTVEERPLIDPNDPEDVADRTFLDAVRDLPF